MNRVESTPEQPLQTPTEASKRFLGGWGKSVIIGLTHANVGAQGFFVGTAAAQGDSESALLHGIVAGLSGLAGTAFGLSQNAEVQSLKDKLLHRK